MNNPPLEIKIMRARSNQKIINAVGYAAAIYYYKEKIKMNNKEELLDKAKQNIEELQKNIKNLEEQLNKVSNKWKPKKDGYFYYISDIGTVETDIYTGHGYDTAKIEMGNCFKTEEEAEFELEKIKVIAELKEFSCEPNWNDKKTSKYYIYYNNMDKKLCIECFTYMQDDVIYFESGEAAIKAIEKIGEYRIKKYLFGKE